MALNSWQSCLASASSTRRLSSSERISPVSCKRSFSASGWALSDACASNLSLRAEMLEESSLSKAWSGYERTVFRIACNYGYSERTHQRSMAPITFKEEKHWIRIRLRTEQKVPNAARKEAGCPLGIWLCINQFAFSFCVKKSKSRSYDEISCSYIIVGKYKCPVTSFLCLLDWHKLNFKFCLWTISHTRQTHQMNWIVVLNCKTKAFKDRTKAWKVWWINRDLMDLRYLKTLTGALGLVDVVRPLAQSLCQVLPLLGDGAQLRLHFYQVLWILSRVPSLGENSLCRLRQLVKLWPSGLELTQHELGERRDGTAFHREYQFGTDFFSWIHTLNLWFCHTHLDLLFLCVEHVGVDAQWSKHTHHQLLLPQPRAQLIGHGRKAA